MDLVIQLFVYQLANANMVDLVEKQKDPFSPEQTKILDYQSEILISLLERNDASEHWKKFSNDLEEHF